MPERAEQTRYGCLFCRVGSEQRVADDLKEKNPAIEAIAPMKLRYHRKNQTDERMILFPGYVFIRADADCNLFQESRHRYVYRVLSDAEHDWRLSGSDASMAQRLFEVNGVIDYSKAYYENDRIRIADGFLKDYEGDIVRVDRRSRTVQIRVRLPEREVLVWLGFELLEDAPACQK